MIAPGHGRFFWWRARKKSRDNREAQELIQGLYHGTSFRGSNKINGSEAVLASLVEHQNGGVRTFQCGRTMGLFHAALGVRVYTLLALSQNWYSWWVCATGNTWFKLQSGCTRRLLPSKLVQWFGVHNYNSSSQRLYYPILFQLTNHARDGLYRGAYQRCKICPGQHYFCRFLRWLAILFI